MQIKPIISEKSLAEAHMGRYTFEVGLAMTKPAIKKLLEKYFGVNITKVQTLIAPGKTYRHGRRRTEKTRSEIKKAIVSLKKGQKIGLFEPGGEK